MIINVTLEKILLHDYAFDQLPGLKARPDPTLT